jgi:hypothetical protein
VADDSTRCILLTESDLTFQRSVEIATGRELAARDVREMGRRAEHVSVHNVPIQSAGRDNYNFKSKSTPSNVCAGCGRKHWRIKECPFKDSECYNCHRKGHIKTICRQKGQVSNQRPKFKKPNASQVSAHSSSAGPSTDTHREVVV